MPSYLMARNQVGTLTGPEERKCKSPLQIWMVQWSSKNNGKPNLDHLGGRLRQKSQGFPIW